MAYQDKNSRWRTGSEVKLLPITSVRFYFDIYTLSGSLISRWDQTCELQDIFWSCSTWRQKVHLNQSTDSLHQVFTLVTALWSGRCTWMEKTNCIEVQPDRSQSESMFKQSYTQHVIFDLSVLRLYTVFVLQYTYCILLWKKNSSMIVFLCFFFLQTLKSVFCSHHTDNVTNAKAFCLAASNWKCLGSVCSQRLEEAIFVPLLNTIQN